MPGMENFMDGRSALPGGYELDFGLPYTYRIEMEELLELFLAYSRISYTEEELAQIEEIITFVDRHTMTVALIAKYLRESGERPEMLLEKLRGVRGITGIGGQEVRHRKDRRLSGESVTRHLLDLFCMSGFTGLECELMRSLSLFGYAHLGRTYFQAFFDASYDAADVERALGRMVRRGWILYEERTEKVYLHQIILDLVYNELQPVSENCPCVIRAMTEYAGRKLESNTEYEQRERALTRFASRITGEDEAFAEFLLAYYKAVEKDGKLLGRIEEICERTGGARSRSVRFEALLLRLGQKTELNELFDGGYAAAADCCRAFTGEVAALAARARSLADTMEMAARAAAYGALSETLGRVEEAYEFYLDEEEKDAYLLPICLCERDAVWTLEKLLKEQEEEIGLEERIGLYGAILRFYGEDEDWTTYHSGHFGDGRKALYYSEKAAQAYAQLPDGGARYADVVVRDGGDTFCGFQTDVSYEACARGESMNGNHEEAIALYKKAIEAGECEAEELYPSIGLEYAELGAYEKAVFYLREAAQIEREKGFEQAGTLELLVGVYRKMGDQASVASCSRLAMAEQAEAARRTEGSRRDAALEHLIWFGMAAYEAGGCADATLLEQCRAYYRQYEGDGRSIIDFVRCHCQRLLACGQAGAARETLDTAKRYMECGYGEGALQIAELLLDDAASCAAGGAILVEAFCLHASVCCAMQDYGHAKRDVEAAEELLQSLSREDGYLDSLVCKSKADCLDGLGEYESGADCRRKCDFYLLADRQADGCGWKRRAELWKDAARAYADREDYEAAARCCERLLALWQEDGAKEGGFADYCEAYMAYIRTLIKAGRTEDARRRNDGICREIAAECRRRADTGDAEEILEYELFWYLEAFAENYEQLGDPVRAVTAMLTGVILSLEGRRLQARDWEHICGMNPDPEWMAERAEELLRGDMQQGEALDRMTAAFARMEQSAAWEKDFPQLRAAYREFQEGCQYRDIELKR